jgi:uncharacterized protein YjbI with pentapeptide repeats
MSRLNYAGQNLRGRSFRRQNLTGANFSNADIRSCNFSEAILEGANFGGAIAGLHPRQGQRLIAIAIAMAGLAGFNAALAAGIFFISFFKYLNYSTVIIGLVFAVILSISVRKYGYIAIAGGLAVAVALAGAGVGELLGAIPGALAIALILMFGVLGAITGAGIYAVIGDWSVLIAGCGSVIGSLILPVAVKIISLNRDVNYVLGVIVALVTAVIVEVLSAIVAHSALNGNDKLTFIRTWAIASSAWGGTSFYKADLTRADFSNSNLEKIDLRFSSIFHTNFEFVTGLNSARLEGTILENPLVRELCTTRNGRGKDYTDMNLNGLCLKGTKMEGATLIRTQVLGTDFTNASLTGACIQGWNFNSETLFDNVDCQQIFVMCDAKGNFFEPKPDNGYFETGQFAKWIQEIKDTIDLIFEKGLNWKAFAFSLVQSAIDNEEDNLSLQSIENKGDGVVVAKVRVPEGVNKKEIHKSLTNTYERAIQILETNHQLVVKVKDEQIATLERLLEASYSHVASLIVGVGNEISIRGEGNEFYFVNNKGKFVSTESNQERNINVGRDFKLKQTGSTFNIGDISGAVTNTVQQLKDSDQPDAPQLADLISQLQVAIESDPCLTEEQKKDCLEALATIGEEGQKPPESRVQKLCKFAVNSLKALVPVATTTGALAKALQEYLPQISTILGL